MKLNKNIIFISILGFIGLGLIGIGIAAFVNSAKTQAINQTYTQSTCYVNKYCSYNLTLCEYCNESELYWWADLNMWLWAENNTNVNYYEEPTDTYTYTNYTTEIINSTTPINVTIILNDLNVLDNLNDLNNLNNLNVDDYTDDYTNYTNWIKLYYNQTIGPYDSNATLVQQINSMNGTICYWKEDYNSESILVIYSLESYKGVHIIGIVFMSLGCLAIVSIFIIMGITYLRRWRIKNADRREYESI